MPQGNKESNKQKLGLVTIYIDDNNVEVTQHKALDLDSMASCKSLPSPVENFAIKDMAAKTVKNMELMMSIAVKRDRLKLWRRRIIIPFFIKTVWDAEMDIRVKKNSDDHIQIIWAPEMYRYFIDLLLEQVNMETDYRVFFRSGRWLCAKCGRGSYLQQATPNFTGSMASNSRASMDEDGNASSNANFGNKYDVDVL
ncbi:hypothetical protein SADUNF_Sadunf14G0093600 [Salix dunnii]|uniref:Uncharacterized protein n=1 Tax=Salix dunnii TaxID=1413687 RepID=A0A835JIJ5_9ROSI|nr:hypothetical protein SADUNF_Sadunf14G0093600 [Salix dunnii]